MKDKLQKIIIFLKRKTQEMRDENPEKLFALFMIVVASIMIIVFLPAFLSNKTVNTDHIDSLSDSMRPFQRPEDMIDPFGHVKIPEPIIKVIHEKAEPKIEKKKINPYSLFNPLPPPVEDKQDTAREEFYQKSLQALSVYDTPSKTDIKLNPPSDTKWYDTSEDKDYSSLGLAKNIPSYPVKLDRALTTDNFINAVLQTDIRSDIGSQKVLAFVENNVYASHGNKILIPKYSKILGTYQPLSDPGEERLQVTWTRIITPNGISIVMDAEGLSGSGAAGYSGILDTRFYDKFGNAIFLSTLSALAQFSIDTNSQSQANAATSFAQEIGSVNADLIANNFDIAPRLLIKNGTRIKVSPLTDIFFKDPVLNKQEIYTASK